MNKLLIAFTAAFLAVTAFFGSAQAGFVRLAAPASSSLTHKAGCGGGGYVRSHYRKRAHRSVRRSVKRPVAVAKKQSSKPVSVAKAEEPEVKAPAETTTVASENSSIASGSDKVAEAKGDAPVKSEGAVKKVAAIKEVGCKQFFPSAGITLSVACD